MTQISALALDLTLKDAKLETALEEAVARAEKESWADRAIGRRDPSVWSRDEGVQRAIADRLGWLEAPFHFADETGELKAFAGATIEEGFTTAVLGGMGGSSLAPALLSEVFGAAEGGIPVRVLDSTDPAAVAATLEDLEPTSTLFIVSTKSGTTAESLSFQAYQWERIAEDLKAHHVGRPTDPGDFMVAITDPDKSFRSIPHHDELREAFLNSPDVGGRYSALTLVGLVPGALLGLDLDELLRRGRDMIVASGHDPATQNPALSLGLAMGVFAQNGRDKLTFVIDREIAPFGPWVEQLIAESTGKHGVGIVPVVGEPLGKISTYNDDRVFVRITLTGSAGPEPAIGSNVDARLKELAAAGHPVIRLGLDSKLDLGAEFLRWEIATALSGIVLGIDPFDQPNVEEAKANTRAVLSAFESGKGGPVHGDATSAADEKALTAALESALGNLHPNGYVAIQAYVAPTPERDAALEKLRVAFRDRLHRATTVGYGPRFLHSTGQLHKGGAPIGWFLQLVCQHPEDRPIPGKEYTFGNLIDAQAVGDARTLRDHSLPVLRVDLGPNPEQGLAALQRAAAAALERA